MATVRKPLHIKSKSSKQTNSPNRLRFFFQFRHNPFRVGMRGNHTILSIFTKGDACQYTDASARRPYRITSQMLSRQSLGGWPTPSPQKPQESPALESELPPSNPYSPRAQEEASQSQGKKKTHEGFAGESLKKQARTHSLLRRYRTSAFSSYSRR